jgi:hypothetical protein
MATSPYRFVTSSTACENARAARAGSLRPRGVVVGLATVHGSANSSESAFAPCV